MITKDQFKKFLSEDADRIIHESYGLLDAGIILAKDRIGEIQSIVTADLIDGEDGYCYIAYFSNKLQKFVIITKVDPTVAPKRNEIMDHLDEYYDQICAWEKEALELESKISIK